MILYNFKCPNCKINLEPSDIEISVTYEDRLCFFCINCGEWEDLPQEAIKPYTKLPMSSNKDICETSQVAKKWESLNLEKRSDDSLSKGSFDNRCNSSPLAPEIEEIEETEEEKYLNR